jgi:hypothetical protein
MTYHRRGETKTLLQTRDLPRSRVPAWGYIHLSAVRHEGEACRLECKRSAGYTYFEDVGDLNVTGSTRMNVNDFGPH